MSSDECGDYKGWLIFSGMTKGRLGVQQTLLLYGSKEGILFCSPAAQAGYEMNDDGGSSRREIE